MQRIVIVPLVYLFASISLHADKTDDFMQGQMRERRIPGAALMILQDGKVSKTAAYGLADLEQQTPVTADTVFEIGSITKQFTAAGILLLEQEGKLSVNDRISKYLKDLPDSWTNITVRHLLTHTSGIRNYTGLGGFELTKHLTQKQFIDELRQQPLDFQPGSSWKYCNSGFSLLGFIIENVSGTNYWAYMEQRIFGPLQMKTTGDRRPGRIIPHRARGYEQTNRLWINRDYDLTDVFSAGAIVSTVGDLAKWSAALDGGGLLNAGSKQQMWTPAKLNSGKETGYGFGWFIDAVEGHKNIGHGGSTSGFSASIQRFPDDQLAVILLTNTDEQVATTMAKKIATFYFRSPEAHAEAKK
jgi:CubicO group peptidase (beta-lactamase class C family)